MNSTRNMGKSGCHDLIDNMCCCPYFLLLNGLHACWAMLGLDLMSLTCDGLLFVAGC